jgi:hypothetical protein
LGGAARALHEQAQQVDWRKSDAFYLALSLLVTLCGSANAATMYHAHRRHAIVRANHGLISSDPASGFAYAPLGPPIRYQPAPYNDQPSPYDNRYPNWGG